ncbi:TolC family protein, partial [Escherichia coli]
FIVGGPVGDFELLLCHGTVCVVGKMRDLILQLSKSSIYSTKPQQRYLASLQITLQRARALYQHGAVSYLEVLDAERSLFATRQTLLDLNYARQVNEISLYTALGGGWQQ